MSVHSALTRSIPTELVERLEAAEAGSREMDAAIASAVGAVPPHYAPARFVAGRFDHVWDASRPYEYDLGGKGWFAPAYTTSLDAALALAERVLPGWCFSMATITPPWVQAYPPGSVEDCLDAVAAETLPLALCIAILKATTANSVGTTEGRAPNTPGEGEGL